VSETFSIPQSLAGVTLLALGNGAPDLFASLNAASKSEKIGDQSLVNAAATLLGGAFYLVCVVTFLAVRASPGGEVKVNKKFFLREITFLIITYLYLMIIFFFVGKVTLGFSLGFFIIYGIYVIIVVSTSKEAQTELPDMAQVETNKLAQDYTIVLSTLQKNKTGASMK
jgi:sodium/potassium/calcium exchanger 6